MFLRVEAFISGSYDNKIPKKYTCDGGEVSPGMHWEDAPEGTKSFAIVMRGIDTPDRSTPLVLWLVYNIPGNVYEIKTGEIPEGAQVGTNDRGKIGYSGPCPKPGPDHQRYIVQIYALDSVLDLPDEVTEKEFMKAAKDHILDDIEIVAVYETYKK